MNARRASSPVLWTALGLWVCAGGCGKPANSLSGSLDEIAPLAFESTVVHASPTTLAIEYDHFPTGGGTDVAFKMVVNPTGLTLARGLTIDLTERLSDGTPRTTCNRAVADDPRRNLPLVKRGTLVLDGDVSVGATATGHFNILFDEGGEIGEGRTVDGTFSAPAADATPGGQS